MHDYLKAIIENKKREIEKLYAEFDGKCLKKNEKSFKASLQFPGMNVVAEIKRQSPAKGPLAVIINPITLAEQYVHAGAAAISVLTDPFGFNGSLDDLKKVSEALKKMPVPVLRKDFILDEIQIAESINAGANAILLIVALLKEKTQHFLTTAKKLGIDAVVEVHNRAELDYAVHIGSEIIGVNNRNLTTFEVDLMNAVRLKLYIPEDVVSIAESGIQSASDIKMYVDSGFDAVLIGEVLVKSPNPRKFIHTVKAGGTHATTVH